MNKQTLDPNSFGVRMLPGEFSAFIRQINTPRITVTQHVVEDQYSYFVNYKGFTFYTNSTDALVFGSSAESVTKH